MSKRGKRGVSDPAGLPGSLSQRHTVASKAKFHPVGTATHEKATPEVLATHPERGKWFSAHCCEGLLKTGRILWHLWPVMEKDNTLSCTRCLLLEELPKQRCKHFLDICP